MPSSAPVPIYWDTLTTTQPRVMVSYTQYLRASYHHTYNYTSCLVFLWALRTVRASNPTERAA